MAKYLNPVFFSRREAVDGFILPRVTLNGVSGEDIVRCNERFQSLTGVSFRVYIPVGVTAETARFKLSICGQEFRTDADITSNPDGNGYYDVLLVEGGYADVTITRTPPAGWGGEFWFDLQLATELDDKCSIDKVEDIS